jgi:plasmid segregation protein ParM
MIIGVDAGNNAVKLYGEAGPLMFPSAIGEYRERNVEGRFSADDMIYEFKGKKGFAGTLALNESEFSGSRMGTTKAHEELLLRVLLGLHRYGTSPEYQIIVGQPIKRHTVTEKAKMRTMLQGQHEFTLNGVTRLINIVDVGIAPEGSASFWAAPCNGKVRILDFGSGTVNGAALIDGAYVDKDSFTLEYGFNTTLSEDRIEMARAVAVHALKKWRNEDKLLLAGGGAEVMLPHLSEYFENVSLLRPRIVTKSSEGVVTKYLQPVYANAVAFYNIGVQQFKVGVENG